MLQRASLEALAAMHRRYLVDLRITPAEWQRYYAGQAVWVRALAQTGEWLSFPAGWLRAHTDHDGVSGRFALEVDQHNRLVRFERVAGA